MGHRKLYLPVSLGVRLGPRARSDQWTSGSGLWAEALKSTYASSCYPSVAATLEATCEDGRATGCNSLDLESLGGAGTRLFVRGR